MRDNRPLHSFAMIEFNSGNQVEDIRELSFLGLKFKSGRGSYKGINNPSYLVLIKSVEDLRAVLKLASRHSQESILLVDTDRSCELVYINSTIRTELGKWTEVLKHEVKGVEAFTQIDGRYFIAA